MITVAAAATVVAVLLSPRATGLSAGPRRLRCPSRIERNVQTRRATDALRSGEPPVSWEQALAELGEIPRPRPALSGYRISITREAVRALGKLDQPVRRAGSRRRSTGLWQTRGRRAHDRAGPSRPAASARGRLPGRVHSPRPGARRPRGRPGSPARDLPRPLIGGHGRRQSVERGAHTGHELACRCSASSPTSRRNSRSKRSQPRLSSDTPSWRPCWRSARPAVTRSTTTTPTAQSAAWRSAHSTRAWSPN